MSREKLIKDVEESIQQIIDSKVPEEKIISQLENFEKGLSFLKLKKACTPHAGIHIPKENEFVPLTTLYLAGAKAGRIMKFVPASGAASRMFKPLLSLVNSGDDITASMLSEGVAEGLSDHLFAAKFIGAIDRFAFFEDLKSVLWNQGLEINQLLEKGVYTDIFKGLLLADGLNYANLPKGLIKFHKYPDHSRTAFEEHLVEAIAHCRDTDGNVVIHFTVPTDHRDGIESHFEQVRPLYEKKGVRLNISFSIQDHASNTIAVNMDNDAFRDENGQMLFRPGGHGALIENLMHTKADIVFIKNIDNLSPDRLKPTTIHFKCLLGGYLIQIQNQIFAYLEKFDREKATAADLADVTIFLKEKLFISFPGDFDTWNDSSKIDFLYSRLNRPIRICGMVKNQGDPGGGPFLVAHDDNSFSLQIVEAVQVDMDSPEQLSILKNSTHFNPVDIVCGIRDYKGNVFDLTQFIDPRAGFISEKSKDGKELKALELPGLWNGAMAYWNTVFIGVPGVTFNPVKTVNDLLREEHLADLENVRV